MYLLIGDCLIVGSLPYRIKYHKLIVVVVAMLLSITMCIIFHYIKVFVCLSSKCWIHYE